MTLTWDNPQDDSITGYVILRRDREIHLVGTFVTITGDTGSADTTYTDDTVEPDKQYVYRIKAINEHGEVSEESDWVRGFTPAAPGPGGLAGAVTGGGTAREAGLPGNDDTISGATCILVDANEGTKSFVDDAVGRCHAEGLEAIIPSGSDIRLDPAISTRQREVLARDSNGDG